MYVDAVDRGVERAWEPGDAVDEALVPVPQQRQTTRGARENPPRGRQVPLGEAGAGVLTDNSSAQNGTTERAGALTAHLTGPEWTYAHCA